VIITRYNVFLFLETLVSTFQKLRKVTKVTKQIMIKRDFFFRKNFLTKCKFHQNLTRITGTLHEAQYTFLIRSRSAVVRMRNFANKICREDKNTHFMFHIFPPEIRAVYEIMWQNIAELGSHKMTH
jgi:hypothetical protein